MSLPKKAVLLGIDTSNYTTSAALSQPVSGQASGGVLFRQEKKLLTVREGERGLRQSDAVFQHTVNLPGVLENLFSGLDFEPEIVGVGYSARPRDLDGSYMPCFLAGEASARGIAASLSVPVYRFSHQAGHLAAAAYSAGKPGFWKEPFLAFHVSGGTTDLLHVTPAETTFVIEQIGTSLDLNAGQCIDRTGVMLGLRFPCGPALEALAVKNTEKLPSPKICVKGCDCNLSGLENLTQSMKDAGCAPEKIAAFAFEFLKKTLGKMTENALLRYPGLPVLYAGGVMSNHLMRTYLSSLCDASFAEPSFSSDNAAGISLLACRSYLRENNMNV